MKAVIDTNVIIYDLLEDSEFHEDAERILDDLERWMIPSIVIHELVWFLKEMGHYDPEYVYAYINNEKSEILCDSYDEISTALSILAKEGLSPARYNDLVILSHALTKRLPLVTFDKRLAGLARRYGVTVL